MLKDLPDTITSISVATVDQPENIKEQPQLENLGGQHEDLNFPTASSRQIDQIVDHFGEGEVSSGNEEDLGAPPSSISLKESYDIAYAHTRELTDSNLLELVEKEMIQRSLTESGGNQVKASALLGITRATLRKKN